MYSRIIFRNRVNCDDLTGNSLDSDTLNYHDNIYNKIKRYFSNINFKRRVIDFISS